MEVSNFGFIGIPTVLEHYLKIMKLLLALIFVFLLSGNSYAVSVDICNGETLISSLETELTEIVRQSEWEVPGYTNKREKWTELMVNSVSLTICDIFQSSTESFAIDEFNYPDIFSYYDKMGFNLKDKNKIFIYPFQLSKFFAYETPILPLAIHIAFTISEYLHFSVDRGKADFLSNEDLADFEISSLNIQTFSPLNEALADFAEKIFNSRSLILVDSFYWNFPYTEELDRQVILVHELRHQYDFEMNPSLYYGKMNWAQRAIEYLKSFLPELTDKKEVSKETQDYVNNIIRIPMRPEMAELINSGYLFGYQIPDEETLKHLLLEYINFSDQSYMNIDAEINSFNEQYRYLLSLNYDCTDISLFYHIWSYFRVLRTTDRHYFTAPYTEGDAINIFYDCSIHEASQQ